MGTACFADCSTCGLHRRVSVGSTRISHAEKRRYFPAISDVCNTLVEANVWGAPVCSKCQSTDVRLYGDQTRHPADTAQYRDIHEGKHLCPHCKNYTLVFEWSGVMTD